MDMQELLRKVDQDDGITAVPMGELRKLYGSQRLGRHVNEAISKELASVGLGHLPSELPMRKEEKVRLYRLGSKIDRLVTSVLFPTYTGDVELRNLQAGLNGDAILAEFRAWASGGARS